MEMKNGVFPELFMRVCFLCALCVSAVSSTLLT
jgi:hypothetical protein